MGFAFSFLTPGVGVPGPNVCGEASLTPTSNSQTSAERLRTQLRSDTVTWGWNQTAQVKGSAPNTAAHFTRMLQAQRATTRRFPPRSPE